MGSVDEMADISNDVRRVRRTDGTALASLMLHELSVRGASACSI